MKERETEKLSENKEIKKRAAEEADEIVSKWELRLGKPLEEHDGVFLGGLLRLIVKVHCEERAMDRELNNVRTEAYGFLSDKLSELVEQAGKKRIKKRPDQVDKCAFQEAVLANIGRYLTIADAVRDLQPRFPNRRLETLHRWAKEVWPVQPKAGRPAKKED